MMIPASFWKWVAILQPRNTTVWSHNKWERKRVPIAVVERLPGFAIVTTDIGAVVARNNPRFERLTPLHCGTVAVRQTGGSGPCPASVGGPCGSSGRVGGFGVVSANCDESRVLAKSAFFANPRGYRITISNRKRSGALASRGNWHRTRPPWRFLAHDPFNHAIAFLFLGERTTEKDRAAFAAHREPARKERIANGDAAIAGSKRPKR